MDRTKIMFKVSALVSLYNSAEFVEGCLQDLVDQSLFKGGGLQIVVIDSNSPQGEYALVRPFIERYPESIIFQRTEKRETLYQTWNRAIKISEGEFITNANSDDRHHPEALEIMAHTLDKHAGVDLVYADVFESSVANQTFFENPRRSRYRYPTFFAPDSLLYYQFGCQPIWRRAIHSIVGDFSNELKAAGDWEFCIRFALSGLKALHIPQPLGCFLNRPTSLSTSDTTSFNEQALIRERYLSLENIVQLYRLAGWEVDTPQQKAILLTDFARRASAMPLPWTPGGTYYEPSATLISCLAAYEIVKDDPRIAWNLGVALYFTDHKKEATQFLELGRELKLPEIEASLSALGTGQTPKLEILPVLDARP
jgi:glycosyltransferase involved in cell wall biosynthesis